MSKNDNYFESISTRQIIVGRQDGADSSATAPSLAFGDGDTGFFESGDDVLDVTIAGTKSWTIGSSAINASNAGGLSLRNEAASLTNPTLIPNKTDLDTGIGWTGDDALSLIAGAKEGIRLTETSNNILIAYPNSIDPAITANAGGGQGSAYQLIKSYSIVTIVGTNGDSVKMPASFPVGTIMYIMNADAAQSINVFPASGDDIGAGANTAISVAFGEFISLIATTADATWAKFAGS